MGSNLVGGVCLIFFCQWFCVISSSSNFFVLEVTTEKYSCMAYPVYTESLSFGGSEHGQGQQVLPFQAANGSLKVSLLHGNLAIWVMKAKKLPNMDMLHKTLGDVFLRLPSRLSSKSEGKTSDEITSDPYVTISVAGAVVGRTFVISNSENPVWEQHFDVPVAHYASEVHFVVKDSDVVGSQIIGAVGIPVERLVSGMKVEGTFPILNSNGKICKPGATLTLSIQYTPIENLTFYNQGVGSDPDHQGVPGTYFPLRRGGRVTLYQDAHVHDGCLPNLELDGRVQYEQGNCWQDMFDAISQARRLIYITGWSVYHKVRLVRNKDETTDYMLGDLLKTKSQEGVRVLLLVWDDPTSRSILGYKTVRPQEIRNILFCYFVLQYNFGSHNLILLFLHIRMLYEFYPSIEQVIIGPMLKLQQLLCKSDIFLS